MLILTMILLSQFKFTIKHAFMTIFVQQFLFYNLVKLRYLDSTLPKTGSYLLKLSVYKSRGKHVVEVACTG